MGLFDTLEGLLTPGLPPPPRRLVAGAKRKASKQGGRPAKARKFARPASGHPFPDHNYGDADLYEGALRRDTGRSFDHGYLDQGQTLLEQVAQDERLPKRTIQLIGTAADDLHELIEDMPVAEEAKDEVREGVVQKLLEKQESPPSRRPSHQPLRVDIPESEIPQAEPSTAPSRKRSSTSTMVTTAWDTTPNKKARSVLQANASNVEKAGKAIKQDTTLAEPEYAFRDVEIRDALWDIMSKMQDFAGKYFGFKFEDNARNRKKLTAAFQTMTPETVMIIRCVGSGGPGGQNGWRDLFFNKEKRKALVCGIIGKLFVQQVYQHGFFGGSIIDETELARLQKKHQDEDGFDRHAEYAKYIMSVLNHTHKSFSTITLPVGFNSHVKVIVDSLMTHLDPLMSLRPVPSNLRPIRHDLYDLATQAGILSLLMRVDPHTVYYFTPMFKEDKYDHQYMECFNHTEMQAQNPRTREAWPEHYTAAEISRAKGDEPLTSIVVHDGVTAYRVGGWETTDSTPWKVVFGKGMAGKGIRSRILTHGWVYCRWGRSMSSYGGKGKTDRSVHGVQWKEPGFVGFDEVEGVPGKAVLSGVGAKPDSRRTTV